MGKTDLKRGITAFQRGAKEVAEAILEVETHIFIPKE